MQNITYKKFLFFYSFILLFFVTIQTRAQFPFFESFKNSSAPNIQFGGVPPAFLTGGAGPQLGFDDNDGDGYLRLTNNRAEQRGMIWSDSYAFPSVYGMTISFEYYTHTGNGSNGADGLCFVLFDAAVTSVTSGAYGGSLGYAQTYYLNGFSGGYLGVGLDEYGNFAANSEGKSGGTTGITSNSVVLRGQGSGNIGYPYLTSTQTTASPYSFNIPGKDRTATDNSKAGFRKVEIVLKPRSAGGFFIDVYIEHGTTKSLVINNYEYTTLPPPIVKFAITSSTGGDNNYHEIRNLNLSVDLSTLLIPKAKPVLLSDCAGLTVTTPTDINLNNDGSVNTLGTINRESVDLDLDAPGIQSTKIIPGKGTFSYDSITGKVTFTPLNNSVEESITIDYTFNDTYGKTSNVSTITYNPVVNRPADVEIRKTICSGDTYILPANNQSYSNPGTYNYINNGCEPNQTLILTVLPKPDTPIITTTAATCSTAGTSKIDNYSSDNTYTFDPTGPIVDSQGFISNIITQIPYTVKAVSKTSNCTSAASSPFIKADFNNSGCYPVLNTTVKSLTSSICNSLDEIVSYEIKITNSGGQTAEGVDLDFIFPDGIIFDSAAASYTNGSSGPIGELSFSNQAKNPVVGSFSIPYNGTVTILLKGKTEKTITPNTYSVDAQAYYLDPTRSSGNPNSKITPYANSYSGTRTYESGGNAPGSNFDGSTTTTDDVIINAKPAPITTTKEICFGASYFWPVTSKSYTNSGTYTKYNSGCTADELLQLTVNPKATDIIANGVSICKGGTGSLTITTDSKPSLSFNGTWNPRTDPKTKMPVLKDDDNPICLFEDTQEASYHTITFSVNVTGTYVLKMTGLNTDYRAGYIYKGNYTLGTCPGDGTWITEGDDYGISDTKIPVLTARLEVGTLYTLVSLVKAFSSFDPLDYTWTLTPPDGGGFFLNPINSWYTTATGGNPISWGTTFNPAGVPGSGLPNTNTAGKTTYYVGDITECAVRVPVVFEIKEDATVGTASSAPEVCINSVLPAITHLTSGITGIDSSTNLPAGVTASFNNNTITITGTPTVSGVFNYSINLIKDDNYCGPNIATGTITVNFLPIVPIVTTTNTSCTAASISKIDNYVSGNTYVFSPSGPAVNSTGIITGMTTGTNYTVKSVSSNCTSASSAGFTYTEQLATPAKPTLSNVTQPTCDTATGTFIITNYNALYNYDINPSAGVVVNGNTVTAPKGEYQITAALGTCTSDLSEKVIINEQPVTPAASITYSSSSYSTTDGISLVSRNGQTGGKYTAAPAGLSIDENTGTIDPSASTANTYIITYTFTNGVCSNTAQTTVKIGAPKIASWLLVKDQNGNGTVEPGETLTFMLRLSNIDPDHVTLKNVTGSIDLPEHTSLVNQAQSIYVTPEKFSFSNPNTDFPYIWDLSYLREPALTLTVKANCDLTGVTQIETKGRIYIDGVEIQTSVPPIPVSSDGTWTTITDLKRYLTPPNLVDCRNPEGCSTALPVSNTKVSVLKIDNPEAVCSGNTVNLSTTINSESTPGTLSYWTDALATIPLTNPNAVAISGTYYIKNTSAQGCEIIKPVIVTITPKPQTVTTTENICFGESFVWDVDGKTYNTSGTYSKFNNGCTADQELKLTVGAKPQTITTTESICFGESFVWDVDGKTYSTSGTYTQNNNGCTADQELKLTVGAKPQTITTTESICFGESFVWDVDGKTYTASGTYSKFNNGCTADQELKLTVGTKPQTITTTENICFGESFVWDVDGNTYTVSGTYTKLNNGCTADQELKLTVGTKPQTITTTESICFGESFIWDVDGKTYTTSGTYSKLNNGCTADQELKLAVGTKPQIITTTESICFGESFVWDVDGKTYTASGTYSKFNNGCTADQELKLTVGTKPQIITTTKNICFGESFVWDVDGKTYNASGTYNKFNNGCTADQELKLTVGTKPQTITTTESICFGESFVWDVDGKTYSASGTYNKFNNGCTADQELKLTVGTKPQTITTTESICFGESFVWDVDGKTYTASGTYSKFNNGCTADQELKLTVGAKPQTITTTESICFGESFVWDVDGKTYTVSGTYTKLNNGCTADQELKLTVGTKPQTITTTESICFGESFVWDVDGKTYTASGIYSKFNNGCTADQELKLTVGEKPQTITTTESICFGESFVWDVDGKTYTASGTYSKLNNGCTADQELKLTVGTKPQTIITTESVCFGESFVWDVDGKTYTASGTYNKFNNGCTADQELKLTVGTKPQIITTTENICFGESFLWNVDGNTYTVSGTYTKLNNGCTADQELKLTVGEKPQTVTTTENICFGESFVWDVDGNTYTVSGTYNKLNNGCTADQELKLTVGAKPQTITTTESICFGESFVWDVDGKTYTASGTYTQNNNGCTADQELKLTVGTKPQTITTTESICFGESFVWDADGKTYTASGTYSKFNNGCTADQELKLTVGTKPQTITTRISICYGESLVWEADKKTYTASGTYILKNNGCTADQVLELTVGEKPETITTTKDICFGESFVWNVDGKTYTESGTYIVNNNGCNADRILKLNIAQLLDASIAEGSLIPEFCSGDKEGSFKIEITGGMMPYSVSLDRKNGTYTPINTNEYTFIEVSGGTHTVYIKDALDCAAELDVSIPKGITINPAASISYSCLNDVPVNSVTITVDSSITNLEDLDYSLDGITYQSDNTFVNVPAGKQSIKVRHTNGCIQSTKDFIIDYIDPLTLTLANGELNEITATGAGGNGQYRYSFNNEAFSTANKFIIYKSGEYTVTVADQNGCTATTSKYFEYIDVCIPNHFTPNGDGINDEWGPGCTTQYKNLTFTVFDRYGRIIGNYKYGQTWDGKYNGAELSSGDYWYVLKLNDNKDNREFVGHFTLYR